MSKEQGMLCHHGTRCFIHLGFVHFFTPLLLFPIFPPFFPGGPWGDVTASLGEAPLVSRLLLQLCSQGKGQGENPLWSWDSYR